MNEDNFEKKLNEFISKEESMCLCDNIFDSAEEYEDYLQNEFGQHVYEYKYMYSYAFIVKEDDDPIWHSVFRPDYTHSLRIKSNALPREYVVIGVNYCPKCGKKLEA